jgi:glycosyltransferase involved in cell wall biosynthesis
LKNLTIVIPALNEEKDISFTVNEIISISKEVLDKYEIILVDDFSQDKTGEIMDSFAKQYPEITVIHHDTNTGLGQTFREGIHKSKYDYLALIPGDNAYNTMALKRLFMSVDSADLIVSYRINQRESRPLSRVIISNIVRIFMSSLFRLPFKDISSVVIYPIAILRNLDLKLHSDGYMFQIETLVNLYRCGVNFRQEPVKINPEPNGQSKAIKLKTLIDMVGSISYLLLNSRPHKKI